VSVGKMTAGQLCKGEHKAPQQPTPGRRHKPHHNATPQHTAHTQPTATQRICSPRGPRSPSPPPSGHATTAQHTAQYTPPTPTPQPLGCPSTHLQPSWPSISFSMSPICVIAAPRSICVHCACIAIAPRLVGSGSEWAGRRCQGGCIGLEGAPAQRSLHVNQPTSQQSTAPHRTCMTVPALSRMSFWLWGVWYSPSRPPVLRPLASRRICRI
jgi:hypothetical protein